MLAFVLIIDKINIKLIKKNIFKGNIISLFKEKSTIPKK
jgi:hypothetical protein